jgi:hypothetical protein
MNTNLSNSLFRLLADLLAPASELLIDDQLMATLVQDLGVVEHDPAALESLLTSVEAIRQEIEGVQAAAT